MPETVESSSCVISAWGDGIDFRRPCFLAYDFVIELLAQ
jgi:hypothetical protein